MTYFCAFSDGNTETPTDLVVSAHVQNANTVSCVTPQWPYVESSAVLRLLEQDGGSGIRRSVASAKPHVFFNFTSSGWEAMASPVLAVASALGGDELELVSMGEGFDVSNAQGYRVLLTSKSNASYSQSFACLAATSYKKIKCPLGRWIGPGGQVLVRLLRGSVFVGKTGAAVYLNMTAGWDTLDVVSSVVTGGARLVLRGGGFVPGSLLQCSWAMSDGSRLTVQAQVLDSAAVLCLSPDVSQTHPAGNAMLALKFGSGDHVPSAHAGYSSANGIPFTFAACWYRVRSLTAYGPEPQLQIAAQTGSRLQVLGAGFGPFNYSIELARNGASAAVSKPCKRLTRSQLECETPQWQFAAESDAESFYFQEVDMRLLYGDSLADVVQIGQSQQIFVSRAFITDITSTSTASHSPSIISVSAGGDELVMQGNFPCHSSMIPCTYVCNFHQDNMSESATIRSLVSVVSSSTLRFPTPVLMSVRAMTVVVIQDASPFLPIAIVGNVTTRIVFKSMIKSIMPLRVPSSQGAIITVTGSNFETDSSDYECIFKLASGQHKAPATAESSTTLMCSAPALPQSDIADSVPVHIEKCTDTLDQIRRECAAITWEDTSQLRQIAYFAEFGLAESQGFADAKILWVQVHGLNDTSGNDYRLVFEDSASHQMIAPVTLAEGDFSEVLAYALLPPWPFAAASTQASLERGVRVGSGTDWQLVQPFSQAEAIYQFMKVVRDVVSVRIPSVGCEINCWPSEVVIDTGGIDAGDGALFCKFVGQVSKRIVISQDASNTSSGPITCLVNEMDYAADTFDVSLIQSGDALPFSLRARTSILFSEQITKVSPLSRPASGGSAFGIHGFGFVSGQTVSYLCRFSNSEQRHEQNTTAWVESSFKMFCPAPNWNHAASAVNMSVIKRHEEHGRVTYQSLPSSIVHLTPVWWFSAAPSGSFRGGIGLHPSPGYDHNTPMLTFIGVGFDAALSYYAEFTAVNAQGILYSATSIASSSMVMNSRTLLVQVPPFDAGVAEAGVTLISCKDSACVSVAKERGLSTAHPWAQVLSKFHFVGQLIAFNRTVFTPGRRLVVTGDIFAVGRSHSLVISSATDTGANVRVSAETVDASTLSFTLPTWPFPAGEVYAKIFQDEGEVRWNSTAPSFEYEEAFLRIDPLSGPAHGSIFIQGLAIRPESGCYSCIFRTQSGLSERHPGTQLSSHNISCSAPSNFGGNVSVFLVKESQEQRTLLTSVFSNSNVLQIQQASSVPAVVAGALLLLDGEIMEVAANADENGNVHVHRGKFDTPQWPHASSTLIDILVRPYFDNTIFYPAVQSLPKGSIVSGYHFRPSFSSVFPREALISGAALISVVGHLLKTGPLESYRCRFTTAGGDHLDSAPARAEPWDNDSQIVRCLVTVPASWTEQEGLISLLSGSNQVICSNMTSTTCNPGQYSSSSRYYTIALGGGSYPSEVTVEIQDSTGTVVFTFTPQSSLNYTISLDAGDYKVVPIDSYGDGWNGASIEVKEGNAVVLSIVSAEVTGDGGVSESKTLSVAQSAACCTCPGGTCQGSQFFFSGFVRRQIALSGVSFQRSFITFDAVGLISGSSNYSCAFSSSDDLGSAVLETVQANVSGGHISCPSPALAKTSTEYIAILRASYATMVPAATALPTTLCVLTSIADSALCADTNMSLLQIDRAPHEYSLLEMSRGVLSRAKVPSGGTDRVHLFGGGHNPNGSYYCVFEVLSTGSAVWTPATASFDEISCPTPPANKSVWMQHFRKLRSPEVRFNVLAGGYMVNRTSHFVPVASFRFSCVVASKLSSWGIVSLSKALQWMQPDMAFQPRLMSCSDPRFIRFEGGKQHLRAAPILLQTQTHGGLTMIAVVKLLDATAALDETILQGNQVTPGQDDVGEAHVHANASGPHAEIFLGRKYDQSTKKSQLMVKVGNCTASSNLDAVPQNMWMTLVLSYRPLNSQSSQIRLTKNAQVIASANCSTPIMPDDYFRFQVSSSRGPGLVGDLGVAFVADRVISQSDIASEIRQQQQVLGYAKVQSQQIAVVEFLPFQFGAALLSVMPSSATSAGGTPVYVSAVYFDVEGIYSCVFSSATNKIASAGVVLNATTAMCNSPSWNSSASNVSLRLVAHSTATPPASGELLFEIKQNWVSIHPQRLLSDGGHVIHIVGSGFNMKSSYTCRFARRMEQMMSACTVFNTTHMNCFSPAWGMNFSGSWGDAHRLSAADDPVMVTLVSGDNPVLRASADSTNAEEVAGCDSLACPIHFQESVDNRGEGAVDRSQGPAAGGWSVIVAGYGFHANSTYLLNLSSAGPARESSAPCELLSASRLRCHVLRWAFEAADAYATLLVVSYGNTSISFPSAVQQQGEAQIMIRMQAVWTATATDRGVLASANGGDLIHVYGAGFSRNNTASSGFMCLLARGEQEVMTPARWLSSSHLVCVAPEWPFAFGETTLSLYQMRELCSAVVLCSGTCACKHSDSLGAMDGAISDGLGEYEPNARCEWILSSQCSAIVLEVDVDTEACCDHLTIDDYRTGTEVARLSGFTSGNFTIDSGQVRVVFESDAANPMTSSHAGFLAKWQVTGISPGFLDPVPLLGENSSIFYDQILKEVTLNVTTGIYAEGPSYGGFEIYVLGFGFDVTSADYECVFIRDSSAVPIPNTTAPPGCECIGKAKARELLSSVPSSHSTTGFGADYGGYCAAWEDGVCSYSSHETGPMHTCGNQKGCEEMWPSFDFTSDQVHVLFLNA